MSCRIQPVAVAISIPPTAPAIPPIPTTEPVESALKQRVLDVGVKPSDVAIDDRGVLGNPVFRRSTALINARPMPFRYSAEDMVWFDFEALCGPPRSQNDYIELARCHQTVFMSDIPVMGGSRDDRTRRFIFLVDEFYDRRVKLILSAAAPVAEIYAGERLKHDILRTQSRLEEMQSHEYLADAHKP